MKYKTNFFIAGVKLLLAVTCVGSAAHGIWSSVALHDFAGSYFMAAVTALIALVILHVPDFIIRKDIMAIPMALQVFFSAFTFCAMFLGEILDFYTRFSWWDTMLHFSSGILLSMVGYLLFTSLNRDSSIRRRLNPLGVILFAVCFSVACGVIWEVFEFAGDSFLGMNMQRWRSDISIEEWTSMRGSSNFSNPGLINTMKDIIADTFGSICSVAVLLPLVKHKNSYVKAQVSSRELLEESRQAFDGLRSGKAPAPVKVLCTQAQDTQSYISFCDDISTKSA